MMTDVSVSVPLLLLFVLPGVVSGQHSSMVWWFSSPPPDDPLNSTHSFHPPLVMVIMLLICVFFFIGFIIIYIYPWQNESRSDLPFHARLIVHRGLDSNLMESFPIFTYSAVKGLKIGMGSLECAVCLSEFQDDDKLRFLPQCSHTFHLKCIDAWLSSHATCPVCRTNLKENSSAVAMGAVLVNILAQANDPRSHRQEDADQSRMVNHVAAGVSNVEPNSNVVPSAVILSKAKTLRFLSENASTKKEAKPSMMFLRSHSTGHSFHPPESYERFALRLPERWTFSITPPFIHRSSSSRSHRGAAVAGGAASTSKPTSFPPFDRTGSRADAAGRSSWSAATSVQFQA